MNEHTLQDFVLPLASQAMPLPLLVMLGIFYNQVPILQAASCNIQPEKGDIII